MPALAAPEAKFISTATTTQCYTGQALFMGVFVGETAAGAIQVYDDTDGTANQKMEIKASIAEGWYEPGDEGVKCAEGVRVVTGAASKISVVYKPFA